MADEKRQIEGSVLIDNMPTRISVFNENELTEMLLQAHNRGQRPTVVLVEDDGTLRSWGIQVGQDADGNERVALVEADRTPRSQLVLWETGTPGPIRWRGEDAAGEATVSLYGTNVSGNIQAIENEDTGELRVVQLGSDDVGNLDRLRTDPNRIPWMREYKAYHQLDPLEIGDGGVANNLLFNPGPDAFRQYEIDYMITNVNGAAVTVTVGVDVGGTGVVTHPWMDGEIVPYPGTSGWRSGGIINGDDDVRGVTSAVGAIIHWRIRRIDIAGA